MNQLRRVDVAMFGGGRQFAIEHRAHASRGAGRFFLADRAAHFLQTRRQQFLLIQRRLAGEQFVEQHAERVDIGACVNLEGGQRGLLRTHVGGRAMNCSKAVKTVLSVSCWSVVALAMPKSMTLGHPGAPVR